MASTTALFTGLSGLSANSRQLDVIGNNISNVNTTAYKSNRMLFAPTFSRTFSLGTSPSDSTGGTNPGQVGLGVSVAGTQRNFANGAIGATGVSTDVAIEGDGFFIVDSAGTEQYTRSGAFVRNEENDLVTSSGDRVKGFAVDEQFNVVEGELQELNIPVGTLTLAEATRNVVFNGNLNASGPVATTGSIHSSRAFYTDMALGNTMTGSEDLTVAGNDLYIDDGTANGVLAIEGGSDTVLTISGIEKGGKDLGTHTFALTDSATADSLGVDAFGSTMNDYTSFLQDVLGLDSTVIDGNDLGGGVSINGGQVTINGNEGTAQELDIETADIVANGGAGLNQPLVITQTGSANGESVRTSFVVYDSLGTPLTVDLTYVLQETTPGEGTKWEFIAESNDNDGVDRTLGLGSVEFDSNGKFVTATNQAFSIDRDNGAVDPLTVNMDFNSDTDAISALTDTASTLAAVFQDGSEIGTLSSFSIGEDGVISGSFTNGLTRNVGQIAIAKFSNAEGLVDVGNNLFSSGPNSGTPLVTTPREFGSGRLVGGALELSNVDLSKEFINMILASTGYSASARVITTTDELIDQLLVLGR